ncbi:c-type cytochrome biogenesis protein CcsB, partial [Actinotalea ferrariae]|nr:c-type cytochrome biogenesis protein CcsB [Actinotalea ferrariae]
MSLGELSTLLVWGATTAYAVALVAFAIDLSRLAETRGAAVAAPALVGASTRGAGATA